MEIKRPTKSRGTPSPKPSRVPHSRHVDVRSRSRCGGERLRSWCVRVDRAGESLRLGTAPGAKR